MDGCGNGFKELVALLFGTSLLRRLRHRLFFAVVTCTGETDVQDPRRIVNRFHALLAAARLPNVRRHAGDLGSTGASALVDLEEKFGVDFSKMVASENAMLARLARRCLEPPSHSSGELRSMYCTVRVRRRSTKHCSGTTWWSTRLRSLTHGKCFQLHCLQLRAKSWWLSTASTRTAAR